MDIEERSEVRDMIHGILDGWQEATVQRENLIHKSLNSIDKHLAKLNGSVAEHTQEIQDLKLKEGLHVADCPVMPLIKKLDTEVETLKIEAFTIWVKKHWKMSIFIGVISLYAIYNIFSVLSIKEIVDYIK